VLLNPSSVPQNVSYTVCAFNKIVGFVPFGIGMPKKMKNGQFCKVDFESLIEELFIVTFEEMEKPSSYFSYCFLIVILG
jgi:hypothetical protein